MKTRSLSSMIAFFLLLQALTLGCGGSEVGNPPDASDSTPGSAVTLPGTAAENVLSAICTKLNSCYGSLNVSSCTTGVLATTQIDTELGLSAGFGTYQSIIDAEKAQTLMPNSSQKSTCLSEIQALSCASTGVQSAYSAAAPSDFSNVYQMIPTGGASCADLY